jgi:hypothetical protein
MKDVYCGIERTLPMPKWGVAWQKDDDAIYVWILWWEIVVSR